MKAWVLAGYLDGSELRNVWRALARPAAFFLLEGSEELRFGCIETGDEDMLNTNDPAAQEEGRLFDHDFELRWQRLRGYPPYPLPFRVRLITDQRERLEQVAHINWHNAMDTVVEPCKLPVSDTVYLWGEAVAGSAGPPQWYEKEVPRLFCW